MTYGQLLLADFVAAVGERGPAPASGSAAAVVAALAAALAELTARLSDDDEALDEALALRVRLLTLADEDAEAYAEFMRSESPEARSRTVDVPLELAEAAARVAQLAERLEVTGNQRLVGDAAAATLLAGAAVQVGARLVELNLTDPDDPRGVRARELAQTPRGA